MKIKIELNDKTKSGIKKSFIFAVVEKTFRQSNLDFLNGKNFEISVALVDEKEMKKINRIYRKKDESTDILSFPEYENTKKLKKEIGDNIFLGELILCYNNIKGYAERKKIDLKDEFVNVLSHGTLHLLSFSHGKKMFDSQGGVVKSFRKPEVC